MRPRNIVGPVVRQIREKKGLTQANLAAKLNLLGWDIARGTLAKLEAQIRWVSDSELLQLADALGVGAADLLNQATQRPPKHPLALHASTRNRRSRGN
jgi:transcriptional regulator with XRE-family HTH domain